MTDARRYAKSALAASARRAGGSVDTAPRVRAPVTQGRREALARDVVQCERLHVLTARRARPSVDVRIRDLETGLQSAEEVVAFPDVAAGGLSPKEHPPQGQIAAEDGPAAATLADLP